MAASNTRFTQNSLGQLKTPIDSDHGIYRDLRNAVANYPFESSTDSQDPSRILATETIRV
jgi:hypothetical protein